MNMRWIDSVFSSKVWICCVQMLTVDIHKKMTVKTERYLWCDFKKNTILWKGNILALQSGTEASKGRFCFGYRTERTAMFWWNLPWTVGGEDDYNVVSRSPALCGIIIMGLFFTGYPSSPWSTLAEYTV